MVHVTYL